MLFRTQACGFLLMFLIINVSLSLADEEPKDIKVKVGKLAAANNHLAIKLYQQLTKGYTKNIFFSPLSLSMAFGMLFSGARKNTVKVLRNVLGYEATSLNNEEISSLFYHLLKQELPDNVKDPTYTLDIANRILVQDGLHVKHEFKEEVKHFFGASVDEVSFEKNTSKIIDEVNHWAEEKTHGKIKKLLAELDPGTVMLLLNAVYFKGIWKTKFESKNTNEQDFYNNGVEANTKKVKFMHLTDTFEFTSTADAQVIELPYKGNNISMIILLPKQIDGLSSVEDNLTSEELAAIRQHLYKQKVILSLPKFEVEYERDMTEDFKALSATEVFERKADFSGISDNVTYVSQVIHKAAIDVNEEGSEAAAATSIGMIIMALPAPPPPPPMVFNANHPFLFAIVDNRNDLILFAGRVNEL